MKAGTSVKEKAMMGWTAVSNMPTRNTCKKS